MEIPQDIFARVDVAQNGSVYLGDFVAALTCVPKRRSVEVEPKKMIKLLCKTLFPNNAFLFYQEELLLGQWRINSTSLVNFADCMVGGI